MKTHPQELAEPSEDVGCDGWKVRRELKEVGRHLRHQKGAPDRLEARAAHHGLSPPLSTGPLEA